MGDILALLMLMLTSFWALATRIAIEEKMLLDKFGKVYVDYCNATWKLLPGLY